MILKWSLTDNGFVLLFDTHKDFMCPKISGLSQVWCLYVTIWDTVWRIYYVFLYIVATFTRIHLHSVPPIQGTYAAVYNNNCLFWKLGIAQSTWYTFSVIIKSRFKGWSWSWNSLNITHYFFLKIHKKNIIFTPPVFKNYMVTSLMQKQIHLSLFHSRCLHL